MVDREIALVELFNRVKNDRIALGIASFRRTPTGPIDPEMLPSIFMIEDVDEVVTVSKRNPLGYPARRQLEVILEIVVSDDQDVKELYRKVRTTVLAGNGLLAENSFVRELRTEGPSGYDIPNIVGIRMVLGLQYADDGQ